MRIRRFLCLLSFLLGYHLTSAQLAADSLLPVVEIVGVPYQKYAAGLTLQKLDSTTLHLQAGQSLAQLLLQRTPLYLKEYGSGQVATVSFRGTGANHTAVLWNGLPINSPTLGQADFSLLPAFALSGVQVQYGSASALYGSGAIGGSVHLQSQLAPAGESYARLRTEAGSFGRLFTGAAATYTVQQVQAETRVYRHAAENDFTYTPENSSSRERNRNSAFLQTGVVQNLQAPSGKRGSWQLNSWWQHTDRQVQPVIGDEASQDQQQDEHLRTSLSYEYEGQQTSWQAQGGWVQEALTFNGNPYKSRQLTAQLQGEYQPSQRLWLQAGSRFQAISAKNETYAGNQADEQRTDVFAMLRWTLTNHWTISAQVRQLLVAGYQAPLTPSLGLEGVLLQQKQQQLSIRASAGRSYRVPTLNDRFWPVVGNPALKAEQAWSAEAGLHYSLTTATQQTLKLRQTVYSIWSDDWIQWRPRQQDGQWAPENLQQVHSRGTETQLDLVQPLTHGRVLLGGQLAYTRATSEKPISQYDWTVGKQLAFTPLWRAAAWSVLEWSSWSMQANWQYTGRRYTDGAENIYNSLPSFALLNMTLGRTLTFRQHQLHLGLQVQNVLNRHYQNYENRAMPGRSLLLVLDYQLKWN